jgi:hypothetical protein
MTWRAVQCAALLLAAFACRPGAGPPPEGAAGLDLPIDCVPGKTCWVAKLVDDDPGEGVLDYMCTHRAENGHSGIDLALRDLEAMQGGVRVLAAAPGTVTAVRDGMKDESVLEKGPQAVEGRECGNGAVIDHGKGWVTQYCHLRSGLLVKNGDRVEAGTALGYVGLSGSTEYPHLHFTVRRDEKVVDPFLGIANRQAQEAACGPGKSPLWTKKALSLLAYTPAAIFNLGFSDKVVTEAEAREGRAAASTIAPDAPALVFWAEIFGLEKNDTVTMQITGPGGEILVEHTETMVKAKARWFQYVGKKLKTEAWPAGEYAGRIEVARGKTVTKETASASIPDLTAPK